MNSKKRNLTHFHFNAVQDVAGFSMTNVEKENYCWILTKTMTNSDKAEFIGYVEKLSNPFFIKAGIFPDCVYQFLIIVHKDLSAELYVNDFPVAVECMTKRDVKKFEVMTHGDIADIRRVKFPNIQMVKTDKVIYCFKVHWKFGLFFDLNRDLDANAMASTLGSLYRYLSFQNVYEHLATGIQFEEMKKDGWFPFIEIIGGEYTSLTETYQNKFHFEERIEKIVGIFNRARIETITNKWWRNQIFKDKEKILKAGVEAFLQGNENGYITCIKTLLTEAEGIIRLKCLKDTNENLNGEKKLLSYLIEKGKEKSGSSESLLLPEHFLKYLKDEIYSNFNLKTGDVELSRTSLSHGVAKAEAYTKTRALQSILVLDQIYFYIS